MVPALILLLPTIKVDEAKRRFRGQDTNGVYSSHNFADNSEEEEEEMEREGIGAREVGGRGSLGGYTAEESGA